MRVHEGMGTGSRLVARLRRGAAVAVLVAASIGGAVAAEPASAASLGSCYAGRWSDDGGRSYRWAWGDCRGSVNARHRLVSSCTNGQQVRSSWFTDGHVDINCPWPTQARSGGQWFEHQSW